MGVGGVGCSVEEAGEGDPYAGGKGGVVPFSSASPTSGTTASFFPREVLNVAGRDGRVVPFSSPPPPGSTTASVLPLLSPPPPSGTSATSSTTASLLPAELFGISWWNPRVLPWVNIPPRPPSPSSTTPPLFSLHAFVISRWNPRVMPRIEILPLPSSPPLPSPPPHPSPLKETRNIPPQIPLPQPPHLRQPHFRKPINTIPQQSIPPSVPPPILNRTPLKVGNQLPSQRHRNKQPRPPKRHLPVLSIRRFAF